MNRFLLGFVAPALILGSVASVVGAPYASGIRLTGGNYEFILNEAADNVVVSFDVGSDAVLGSLSAGRHSFPLGGASSVEVAVARNAAAGFSAVDDSANLWTSFDRPGGLQINTNPASPYFGKIYVNQNRGDTDGSPFVTAPPVTGVGRSLGNGIYALSADRVGVDLTTFAPLSDPNDLSHAKTGGLQVDTLSTSSFYRIGMDDAGNIIAGDWTNTVGGLKYLSADLTTGQELFTQTGAARDAGGVVVADGMGPFTMHGSIVGEPQVRGTYGVDLVVSAMDEDLDADMIKTGANDGNSVWSWNFGSATSPTSVRPELVAAVGDLHTSTGQDKNTSGVNFPAFSLNPAGTHSDGSPVFLDYNIGVVANAQYNAHFDKWYLSGARSNGDDSSSLVVLTPEGAGGDGRDIEVDWASKQFTIDNGLDSFEDDPADPLSQGNNDIFRRVNAVAFSPDNSIMWVMRNQLPANAVLTDENGLNTAVLGVPLDENGLPDIQLDDNGTPGDPSDDFPSNLIPISTSDGGGGFVHEIKTDAAGNVYYTSNSSERIEYFSRGGNTLAITSSDGTFTLELIEALVGDYNGDGLVNAADYTVYRDTLGSTSDLRADGNGNGAIDPGDLTVWAGNYGAPGVAPVSAVPEPSSLMLAALLTAAATARRRIS